MTGLRRPRVRRNNFIPPSGDESWDKVEDAAFDEALSLPAESRIALVERLLTSPNLPTQADIDRLQTVTLQIIWRKTLQAIWRNV